MTYNQGLARKMRELLKPQRGVVEKPMFGGIGFMVRGNLACGVHKDELIVRLSDQDFRAALEKPHVRIFNLTGRPMKGWLMISSGGYTSTKSLKGWIDKALDHARSLPPK